jgi:hypothetical protein
MPVMNSLGTLLGTRVAPRLKTRAIRALVLFAICGGLGLTQQEQAPARNKRCDNSTVDEWGRDAAAQARSFLAKLKLAVTRRDRRAAASMIRYPLRLFVGGRETTVRDSAEFLRKYAQIFQPRVAAAILDQDPECLFGSWQGAMVGDGEVWFQRGSSGDFKIITVNISNTKAGAVAIVGPPWFRTLTPFELTRLRGGRCA